MTIDEAKIKIEELACYARTKGWDDEYTEAVNMTIKALEQQSTDAVDRMTIKEYLYNLGMGIKVTTADCISREAAIVALDDRMSSLENVDMQIAMGFAKGIIHELPPVTAQPKMGQ